nr:UDP-glycosyltransferase 85A5-like [Ziziphus jujuba var. spinosa]
MELKPHVIMVPLLFQGHIKPFLCLAQLLSQTGLYITFFNTRYNHKRFSNLSALSLQFPNLHFESNFDGIEEDDYPRPLTYDFFYGLKYQAKEHLKELIGTLSRRSENAQLLSITCIIGDGSVSFPVDVEELGIPVILFCCHSAHYLLAYICIPKLIEDGQLPYHEEKDTNHRINIEVAGLELEGRLRLKDLPDFCMLKDINDPAYQFFVNEALAMTRSSSVILYTADDLEAPCLPTIANACGRAYTIGPLHALLNSRIGHNSANGIARLSLENQT